MGGTGQQRARSVRWSRAAGRCAELRNYDSLKGLKAVCKLQFKWWLYPGINLHARLRYRRLPEWFDSGQGAELRRVLDAGCGNGMLTYQSFRKGGTVIGISFKSGEVSGSKDLFNGYLGISGDRLRFEEGNLYELDFPANHFDEIICVEVLEHLRRDVDVCRLFWETLKPGGALHVCAPNAEHPYNMAFPLDYEEKGGHVRPGYTELSYRKLLEPLGFELEKVVGLGGPIRQAFNRRIKETQARFGAGAGLPLFFLSLVALLFERHDVNPAVPFSIYIKARKPLESD